MRVLPWAHTWLGLGAAVPTALSALWPGLLQRPSLLAPCVFPCLKVFFSSRLSRAEACTSEACVGASSTGSPASPTPMPTRRHYSTFPEPLSQSPTGFAHRLSASSTPYWTLLQSALSFRLPCLSQALPQFLLLSYSSSWSHMFQYQGPSDTHPQISTHCYESC